MGSRIVVGARVVLAVSMARVVRVILGAIVGARVVRVIVVGIRVREFVGSGGHWFESLVRVEW